MNLLKVIKHGDRIVIKTPQGQTRKGKAVMYNHQYNSWVLNMGGKYGTPGIASEKNIVSVNGKPLPKEEVVDIKNTELTNESGDKYNIWHKISPEDTELKKTEVRAKTMKEAGEKATRLGGDKFVHRIEVAEGTFKIVETNLPNGVRITPLSMQRKWENLMPKALKKWDWMKEKLDAMWYNHDLFVGIDKYKDGTIDFIYGYPLTDLTRGVKITAYDFDAILKDPIRWMIERFGAEKAHQFLQRVKSKSFWENGTIRAMFSSIKKEVAQTHGVRIMDEATYSYSKIKKDPESWYNKTQMMGHIWAKEMLDTIEKVVNKNSGSDWQKYIIANVFDFNLSGKDTWHIFTQHISKKYLAHVQFILRNGGKMSALQLLFWRTNKSGYLKDSLDWALEYAAYKHDKEKYAEWYTRTMGFYGLPNEEASHRLDKYIARLAPKIQLKNLA